MVPACPLYRGSTVQPSVVPLCSETAGGTVVTFGHIWALNQTDNFVTLYSVWGLEVQ